MQQAVQLTWRPTVYVCKKGELVQPQHFRATPHLSHTLLNHFHTMESPTPSPLCCAAPVHASPPIALPNPFIKVVTLGVRFDGLVHIIAAGSINPCVSHNLVPLPLN